MQDYFDEKSTLSVKKEIIEQLKVDGMSDFKISLVLKISEYQVKKLRKEF
jgi:DNA-binding CsgD family transcriptional regulator